jgi:hypothetical protein
MTEVKNGVIPALLNPGMAFDMNATETWTRKPNAILQISIMGIQFDTCLIVTGI